MAGVGNGAATAVTWPLLTALIPPEKTGVFAGLKAAAESVAIPLSVLVAPELFLPRFGYHGIFGMLAINIVLALVFLLRFVHMPRSAEPLLAAARSPRVVEAVPYTRSHHPGWRNWLDAADLKSATPKGHTGSSPVPGTDAHGTDGATELM